VEKMKVCIMTLNPHYLCEAEMQNAYVKHGAFLVQINDLAKSIQRK
jgi:hypothetical protein